MREGIVAEDRGHVLLFLRCGQLFCLRLLRNAEPCESRAQDVSPGRADFVFLQAQLAARAYVTWQRLDEVTRGIYARSAADILRESATKLSTSH